MIGLRRNHLIVDNLEIIYLTKGNLTKFSLIENRKFGSYDILEIVAKKFVTCNKTILS